MLCPNCDSIDFDYNIFDKTGRCHNCLCHLYTKSNGILCMTDCDGNPITIGFGPKGKYTKKNSNS